MICLKNDSLKIVYNNAVGACGGGEGPFFTILKFTVVEFVLICISNDIL